MSNTKEIPRAIHYLQDMIQGEKRLRNAHSAKVIYDLSEENDMDRLTEYHNGVAVIKGKRYKEAAEKLAKYEDKLDQGYVLLNLKEFLKRLDKLPVPVVREKFEPITFKPIELEPYAPKIFDTNLLLKYSGAHMMPNLMNGIVIKKVGEEDA